MALLGLLIAFLANKLLTGAPFDYMFSFFSVLFFSALTACQLAPIAFLAADPELRIKPADSLRFSMLAALQLYLSAGNLIAIALSSSPFGAFEGSLPLLARYPIISRAIIQRHRHWRKRHSAAARVAAASVAVVVWAAQAAEAALSRLKRPRKTGYSKNRVKSKKSPHPSGLKFVIMYVFRS